ncbi:methyltransferase [Kalaharituber pfeilii]|nr:methyltransferase [Kalaharituber pfeilii]
MAASTAHENLPAIDVDVCSSIIRIEPRSQYTSKYPQEETEWDDLDSDYASGGLSDTTSLSSSFTKYQFENGRRYHAYKEGHYAFPNDEKEQDRLDLVHHIWRLRFEGALYLAPLYPGAQRVLDIGTGTGIWAIDFADQFESAEVIGTDISPIQPRWVPPNVRFEVDDCEAPWTFPTNHFDFIHGRNLGGSIVDWDKLYEQIHKHLTPGGYVELQDLDTHFYCDDGSWPDDDPLHEWETCINTAAEKSGRKIAVGQLLKGQLEKSGLFEDIHETVVKTPIGLWPAEKGQKEIGLYYREMMSEGMEGMSMALFSRVLGWKPEEIIKLTERCRKSLMDRRIHLYANWYIVYARKPLPKKEGVAVQVTSD